MTVHSALCISNHAKCRIPSFWDSLVWGCPKLTRGITTAAALLTAATLKPLCAILPQPVYSRIAVRRRAFVKCGDLSIYTFIRHALTASFLPL